MTGHFFLKVVVVHKANRRLKYLILRKQEEWTKTAFEDNLLIKLYIKKKVSKYLIVNLRVVNSTVHLSWTSFFLRYCHTYLKY